MTPPLLDRRVFLHVGTPKSGTTFLQKAMFANRVALREAGVLFPGSALTDMFIAAIEVRGSEERWGRTRAEVAGTWGRLCAEVRDFPGTSVISHEILGNAAPEQREAALEELDGLEVHVVLTARDLGRQVTADWQERVKNGSTRSFLSLQEQLLSDIDTGQLQSDFWRSQHVPQILERWSTGLPADRVHVIPCPPPGADPRELWRRFAGVVGFDTDAFNPLPPARSANESLGIAQIALLRQVNEALGRQIVQPEYGHVVKRFYAQRVLSQHESPRPVYPRQMHAALRELAEDWNKQIEAADYRVHGDLAELLPVEPEDTASLPDDAAPDQVHDIAVASIASVLLEVARLRRQLAIARSESGARLGRARRLVSRVRSRVRRGRTPTL